MHCAFRPLPPTPDLGSFTDKIEEIKASLGDFDTAKITEALGNIDLDSIKDALSGSGIDLSEIAGLLGGGDFDLGAIKDQVDISAVKDALAKLGIDTSMLGDVDILGMLAGLVGGSGSAATPKPIPTKLITPIRMVVLTAQLMMLRFRILETPELLQLRR